MVPAFLAFAVIPIGNEIYIGDRKVEMVVSDLNIGLLYFLAMGSLGVYGIVLAGWSSGSKYPLLGGYPLERADDLVRDRDGAVVGADRARRRGPSRRSRSSTRRSERSET